MNKKQTFESSMMRLEEIAKILEKGDKSLEVSLKLFEEGVELARFCSKKLDDTDKKIKQLVKGNEGFQLELLDLD